MQCPLLYYLGATLTPLLAVVVFKETALLYCCFSQQRWYHSVKLEVPVLPGLRRYTSMHWQLKRNGRGTRITIERLTPLNKSF